MARLCVRIARDLVTDKNDFYLVGSIRRSCPLHTHECAGDRKEPR